MNIQARPLQDGRPAWRLEFRAGKDAATGKPLRVVETFRGTKREAERHWAKRQAEIDAQGAAYVRPVKETLGQYLERWLADYADQHCKPSTAASYRDLVRVHIVPALGAVALADLTAAQVSAWVADMARKPTGRGGTLSPCRVAYARAVLRAALHEAVRLRLIPSNPVELVRAPRQEPKQVEAFTLAEAQALDRAAEGQRLAALVRVAWRTGLRLGELLALRWEDVDWDTGTVSVRRNVVQVKGKTVLQDSTKSKKGVRTIAMVPAVAVELRAHQKRQAEERLKAREWWQDGGLVFCTQEGKPLGARNVERFWYAVRDKAGVPKHGFHSLRHTFATLARAAGVDLADIADALGHESPAFTAKQYAHSSTESRRTAAERFAAFVGDSGRAPARLARRNTKKTPLARHRESQSRNDAISTQSAQDS